MQQRSRWQVGQDENLRFFIADFFFGGGEGRVGCFLRIAFRRIYISQAKIDKYPTATYEKSLPKIMRDHISANNCRNRVSFIRDDSDTFDIDIQPNKKSKKKIL